MALVGEKINAYRIRVKNVKDGELERPRRSWENNTKMDFKEAGWERVGLIYLAEGRVIWRAVVNLVINLRVP